MEVIVYSYQRDPLTGQRKTFADETQTIEITGTLYESADKKGVKVKFLAQRSELRVAVVPDGFHKYSIRGNDTNGNDATVEKDVMVNHNADILTQEDLHLERTGGPYPYIEIKRLRYV